MPKQPHILVIRLSAMGDVAMASTVLRIFVAQNPGVKITFLSKAFLKPLFNDIPNVNFYVADTGNKHKGILGIFKLYRALKKLNFDAIADLHNVLRSKILRGYFFGLKMAYIDKGRAEKKALTNYPKENFKQLKTSHERYADVFRKLGFKIDLSKTVFPNQKKISSEISAISGEKISTEKWIGIAPFAQYKTKMYPLDLMEQVISELSKTPNLKLFLFGGGKQEIEILSALEKKFANTISVAGKLKLDQELALISNLDVMLAMDSGNAHFAAMMGVETVTIWGNTHPFAGFAPFNQPIENCILPDLEQFPKIPTSVYGNKKIEGYENVMRSIFPEKVIKKITNIVENINT